MCTNCGGKPSQKVKERIPGSRGMMRQSFSSIYRLCSPCMQKVREAGAYEMTVMSRRGEYQFSIVGAKTFSWLRALKGEK
jgi:hypothetical protein